VKKPAQIPNCAINTEQKFTMSLKKLNLGYTCLTVGRSSRKLKENNGHKDFNYHNIRTLLEQSWVAHTQARIWRKCHVFWCSLLLAAR